MKKLVSLLLVVVLVFTFMAVSVSAAIIDVPVVKPQASCPQCGGLGYVTNTTSSETKLGENFMCKNMSVYHAHYKVSVYITNRCATCGYSDTYFSHSYVRCPYGSL